MEVHPDRDKCFRLNQCRQGYIAGGDIEQALEVVDGADGESLRTIHVFELKASS